MSDRAESVISRYRCPQTTSESPGPAQRLAPPGRVDGRGPHAAAAGAATPRRRGGAPRPVGREGGRRLGRARGRQLGRCSATGARPRVLSSELGDGPAGTLAAGRRHSRDGLGAGERTPRVLVGGDRCRSACRCHRVAAGSQRHVAMAGPCWRRSHARPRPVHHSPGGVGAHLPGRGLAHRRRITRGPVSHARRTGRPWRVAHTSRLDARTSLGLQELEPVAERVVDVEPSVAGQGSVGADLDARVAES